MSPTIGGIIRGQGHSVVLSVHEKLVLPSVLTHVFHPWWCQNMQSYPTTVLNERMWHFRGSKHTLTPHTYSYGIKTPSTSFAPVVDLWLGSTVVRALDLQSTGLGFDSRPPHCRVATLDKSFTRAQRRWSYDRIWRYRNLISLIWRTCVLLSCDFCPHFPVSCAIFSRGNVSD